MLRLLSHALGSIELAAVEVAVGSTFQECRVVLLSLLLSTSAVAAMLMVFLNEVVLPRNVSMPGLNPATGKVLPADE